MNWEFSCLLFCVSLLQIKAKALPNNVDGYYWRDYDGTIPPDAYPGGTDANGDITYIGQAVHASAILVPGKIIPRTNQMKYEFGRLEYKGKEGEVKILCTKHPEQMQWIKTNSREIVGGLRDKHVIVGGHEIGYRVLIGRVKIDGQMHIGKVHTIGNEFAGIHVTEDGKGWQESDFEVLTFNPDLPAKSPVNNANDVPTPAEQLRNTITCKNGAGLPSGNYAMLLVFVSFLVGRKFL